MAEMSQFNGAGLSPDVQLQLIGALLKAGHLCEKSTEMLSIGTDCSEGTEEIRKSPTITRKDNHPMDGEEVKKGANEQMAQPVAQQQCIQTLREAIEMPNDEQQIKHLLSAAPDLGSRICSECGYQSKWVSELIRHKRVHSSARPYKCKHCDRTSKWKADMIRHLAKVHGIRVLSRHNNRPPAECSSADPKQGNEQQQNPVLVAGKGSGVQKSEGEQQKKSGSPTMNSRASKAQRLSRMGGKTSGGADDGQHRQRMEEPLAPPADCQQPAEKQVHRRMGAERHQFLAENVSAKPQQQDACGEAGKSSSFKCAMCPFEQDSFPLLALHLRVAHSLAPFQCRLCRCQMDCFGALNEHFVGGTCPPVALETHFVVVQKKPQTQPNGGGVAAFMAPSAGATPPPFVPNNGGITTLMPAAQVPLPPTMQQFVNFPLYLPLLGNIPTKVWNS